MSNRWFDPVLRALGGRGLRLLGLGASLLLVFVVLRALYQQREQLHQIDIDGAFLLAATIGTAVVVLGNALGSVATWLLLRRHSAAITLPYSIAMNGLAQMVKYLPGNFLHLAGRFFLIRHLTTGRISFLFSLTEVALLCLTGAGVGLLYLHFLQPEVSSLLGIALLALVGLLAGVVLIARLKLIDCPLSELLLVVLLYLFSFFAYGFAFDRLLALVFDLPDSGTLVCTTLFALAFVAGYVTPGAPGGLGVREYLFMLLAQPLGFAPQALAAVVVFRLLSVAGDLLFAGLAFLIRLATGVQLLAAEQAASP